MIRAQIKKFSILLGVLVVTVFLTTSCQGKTVTPPTPIILGGFPSLNSPMQEVYRFDSSAKSLVPIVENATSLTYLETITYHNYRSVFSPDDRYMAVDVMDLEGYWDLKIYDVTQKDGDPIVTSPIGVQLPKLREGFSADGRYYAFSFYNGTTNILELGILDLANKGNLITLPDAHFIDFSADNQVYALTFDTNQLLTGLNKFDPATQKAETVFQAPANVKLGVVTLSPDQKWVLFTDQTTKTLNRVPVSGGTPEMVYQFIGDNTAVNYDQTGKYLIVLDLSTNQQLLKLFDVNFKEVYTLSGIGTTTMDFSSDGRFFAYQLYGKPNMELYLTDFQAKTYFFIANSGILYKVGISPDNKYLAYLSVESNVAHAGTLYLVRLKDLQSTKIDTNVTSFKFDTDSSLLYVELKDTTQTSSLFRQVPGESTPTALFSDAKGVFFLLQ
jgi:Tol biopolymer transport system component